MATLFSCAAVAHTVSDAHRAQPLVEPVFVKIPTALPAVAAEWEEKQFRLQSPQAYRNTYAKVREQCEWSESVALINHTKLQLQATYPWGDDIGQWVGAPPYENGCSTRTAMLPTSVCRHVEKDEATGDDVEWTITRIGPLTVPKADAGTIDFQNAGYACFTFHTASPSTFRGRTSFLTEVRHRRSMTCTTNPSPNPNPDLGPDPDPDPNPQTIDAYYGADLNDIDYPPIHPHHSNSAVVGYQSRATWKGGPDSEFGSFAAWPPQTVNDFAYGVGESSENTPGFNADMLGCPEGQGSTSACFYVSVPQALGSRTGFPRVAHTDMWSNTNINTLNDDNGRDVTVVMEYGRKWVMPKQPELWTSLFSLDFSVHGTGMTYAPKASLAGSSGSSTGMVWHTYTMPKAGKFVASWFHTHASAISDMWVMDADADAVVPQYLRDHCETINGCGTSYGTSYGVLASTGDINLEALNTTASDVQASILATSGVHVRCAYRSRQVEIANGAMPYGRCPLRAANNKCDDWSFAAGQKISILAFNWPTKLVGVDFQQHQRWFTVASFDALDVNDLAEVRSHSR